MTDTNATRAASSSGPACCARTYRPLDTRIDAARLMAVAVTLPASTRGDACRSICERQLLAQGSQAARRAHVGPAHAGRAMESERPR
jgi:hypothetical protein